VWLHPRPQECAILMEDAYQYELVQPSSKEETSTEFKKPIDAKGDFNKVIIDPRVPDRTMCIRAKMSSKEQAELL
jgi:hypothetical protein